MIFEAELERARQKLKSIEERRERLSAARAQMAEVVGEYAGCLEQFERGLALARAAGTAQYLPVYRRLPYPPHAEVVVEELIAPDDHERIERERQSWDRILRRLGKIQERIERRIKELEERKLRVEFWILEKEETWGKVDPVKVREDMRQIVCAAEELSQLVVGRKVPISFDTSDRAPLGYVPVHKERGSQRMVYLGTTMLAEQPQHLIEHYKAVIVHELGHILLHVKDSGQEYHRLRRLLRERTSAAPGFFDLFNILLDEQLERLLRDTRPEWQRWFNRLDFHVRRIPLWDLELLLRRGGHPDAQAAVQGLAARRLIKVYADPQRPFATIQSAAFFSEVPQVTRLYAFYAVLRHRLPLATVHEGWLRQCLECIPRDFKSLDVFAVHALAVRIYRILMEGEPGLALVKVTVRRGSGEPVEVELPGTWLPGYSDAAEVHDLGLGRRRKARSLGSRLEQLDSEPEAARQPPPPPDSGEGEPPPPPPGPPPPRPRQTRRRKRGRRSGSGSSGPTCSGLGGGSARPLRELPSWAQKAIDDDRKARAERARQQDRKAARSRAAQKKSRPDTADRPQADQNQQQRQPRPAPPRQMPPPPPSPAEPLPSDASARAIDSADRLAAESASSWSAVNLMKGMKRALNQMLKEVREELAGKRAAPPTLDRITPDGGRPSDQRNVAEDRRFPAPEQVIRLLPQRSENRDLAQSIRPLVNVLRPYLGVVDAEKEVQERLTAGRRLLASGLRKHLAYGETRLFADLRLTETEQHRELLVAVLIDTSASMLNDGRLERACRLAALLAECLRSCPAVESVFLGYNQNIYLCGTHEEHALTSLQPAGKTNEAAALDYLRQNALQTPRRRKLVLVLSDGLPTLSSLEAGRWLVRSLEKELGARLLYGALASQQHPAYRHWIDLGGAISRARLHGLGRAIAALLR